LGFVKKAELPAGEFKWLTVVSPEGPDDLELLLEPNANAAAKTFQEALFEQEVPAASFATDDVQEEYERLKKLGVQFSMVPTKTEWGTLAMFDDTCGNLINLHQG
jgi:predicted TIM-barrel fold metal-dependent hydrolase